MSSQLFSLIRTKYNTMSDSQKVVADYILEYSEDIMMNTLSETALACNVSETTVLRFLHKIGFTSYQTFKINLAQELTSKPSETVYEDVNFQDSAAQVKEKIIQATIQSIKDSRAIISVENIEEAVCKIQTARRILIVGMGASASVATDLFHKLSKLDLDAVCSNDAHMINILSSNLTQDDLLIAVSHSGSSREILDAVEFAEKCGCEVCAITSYSKSALANRAQCLLCSSSRETKFRSDAMTSRIIQMMIVDIIYVSIIVMRDGEVMEQLQRSRLAVARNKV